MSSINIERFRKEVQPSKKRISKLEPFKEAILSLLEEGYTGKQIYLYLTEYEGVKITLDAVYKFLRKIKPQKITKKSDHKQTKVLRKKSLHTNEKIEQVIEKYRECAEEVGLTFTMPKEDLGSKEVVANGVKIDITDERMSEEQYLFLALKEANADLINRCSKLRSILKIWEDTLFPVKYVDGRSELVF